MVDQASTRLMSVFAVATVAAKIAVKAPSPATIMAASAAFSKMMCERAIRYTPAVTMVAA